MLFRQDNHMLLISERGKLLLFHIFIYLYICVYCENKNIKNTFLNQRYFATYVAFSSSIKIEIFHKVT